MSAENLTFDQLPKAVTTLLNKVNRLEELLLIKQNPPAEPKEKFLTVEEAAKLLHLSPATVYTKVSRRELPFMKQGKRLYFSNFELMEYIRDGKQLTDAEIEEQAEEYLTQKK